jgi:hypothetical protein
MKFNSLSFVMDLKYFLMVTLFAHIQSKLAQEECRLLGCSAVCLL